MVSLAVTAAAFLIVGGLIAARLLFGWRARARSAERARLVPLLLTADGSQDARAQLWRAADFTADLMVELIQMVRGRERERFIERAAALGVPERLRHHLGDASPRVRQTAAEALGLFPDDRSVARLTEALGDPNSDVRLTAALALAQAGRAPPLEELVERLDIGRSERSLLIVSLMKELARHAPGEVEAALARADWRGGVRTAAAEALADAGRYEAVPLIAEAAARAADGSEELPRYLSALATLGHPAARPTVERALASAVAGVRAAGARAAGKIRLNDLGGRLAELLADPAWIVRYQAGNALVALGPAGVRRLDEAVREAQDPAAATARRVLAELGPR